MTKAASIEVAAIAGTVVLSGAIVASEVDDLLSAARGVSGVKEVENRFEVYETPEEVEGRAGAHRVGGDLPRNFDRWEPAEADS